MSRTARVDRSTKESTVLVELELDGTGQNSVDTGVPFFDHMLAQLAKHGGLDLVVQTRGDLEVDAHHTVEDTSLAVGQALNEALGDRAGLRRYGDALVPLDECLVQSAVDLSGRPYLVHEEPELVELIGSYDTTLTRHIWESIVATAQITLHVRVLSGRNAHHVVEAHDAVALHGGLQGADRIDFGNHHGGAQASERLGRTLTHIAVAIAHCLFNLPLAVWILEGFMSGIPKEIDETAFVDGYSWSRFFIKIFIPNIASGIGVTAFFCFMFSWVELLLARTLTAVNAKPISAIMTRTVSASGLDWGVLAAAGVLTILPGALVIWFVRNHIAKGFALGRV